MVPAMTTREAEPQLNPVVKFALELGPLLVFFFANSRLGIFWATGAFMVALGISLATMYVMVRRIPILPLVTGVFVLVFGGLTLLLQDELFIKLKPTIVNVLFGSILLVGLAMGRSFLKIVFDSVFELTEEGWRKLTLRWGLFFLALALLNEIVWRTQTTDFWVAFKVWGMMPITLVFTLAQGPLIHRYSTAEDE